MRNSTFPTGKDVPSCKAIPNSDPAQIIWYSGVSSQKYFRLERAFADGDAAGVREVYNGTASAYEHDSEESEETSSVEEEHPEENPRDEENTEKIVEEENSAAEDFYEEDSEKDTEEISEEEALPEASGTENYVEENAGISEEETVAAKGPTASEEDEWLYSQPRRFAKKPAHEQKD